MKDIKLIHSTNIYNGKIINVQVDTISENGRQAKREVVKHCQACCILPIDENGNTYIERQYRHGVEQYVLELPAGKIDKGETPEACAVRELSEEIGAICDELLYMGPMLVSPAYCSEIIHLYVAKVSKFTQCNPDEGEVIEITRIPFHELLKKIDEDEITDAKTVMLALKYARMINTGK